jgi:hypothetical protein
MVMHVAPILTDEQKLALAEQRQRLNARLPRSERRNTELDLRESPVPEPTAARPVTPPDVKAARSDSLIAKREIERARIERPKEVPSVQAVPKPGDSASAPLASDPATFLAGPFVQLLRERLGISDAQALQIQKMASETRDKIRRDLADLRGFPDLQLEAFRRSMRTLDSRVVASLTEEQRPKYKDLRIEIRQRMRANILQERRGVRLRRR